MARREHVEHVVGQVGRCAGRRRSWPGSGRRRAATLPTPMTATPRAPSAKRSMRGVGVAAVPGDELGGREAAGQVLAGDAEPAVDRGAAGEDDRVVVLRAGPRGSGRCRPRRCRGTVRPAPRRSCAARRDRLDLGVVRGDAVAHQPVRARQPVEHVDLRRAVRARPRRHRPPPGRNRRRRHGARRHSDTRPPLPATRPAVAPPFGTMGDREGCPVDDRPSRSARGRGVPCPKRGRKGRRSDRPSRGWGWGGAYAAQVTATADRVEGDEREVGAVAVPVSGTTAGRPG